MLSYFLLIPMVSSETIYCYSNGFSLVSKVYFSILLLSRLFSLFLVFRCLTMICFDVDFFGCILLRRVQLLKSIDLCLLPSLEHFSAIISSTFFSSAFFLLSFQSSDYTNNRSYSPIRPCGSVLIS